MTPGSSICRIVGLGPSRDSAAFLLSLLSSLALAFTLFCYLDVLLRQSRIEQLVQLPSGDEESVMDTAFRAVLEQPCSILKSRAFGSWFIRGSAAALNPDDPGSN